MKENLGIFGLIGGMEIIPSRSMVEPDPSGATDTRWYTDWRQRLHRNLNRPSTGRWEPLTFEVTRMVPMQTIYKIRQSNGRDVLLAHPSIIQKLEEMDGIR